MLVCCGRHLAHTDQRPCLATLWKLPSLTFDHHLAEAEPPVPIDRRAADGSNWNVLPISSSPYFGGLFCWMDACSARLGSPVS